MARTPGSNNYTVNGKPASSFWDCRRYSSLPEWAKFRIRASQRRSRKPHLLFVDNDVLDGRVATDYTDVCRDRTEFIDVALSRLPFKLAVVLRAHFGIGIPQPALLREIGKSMGVNKEGARCIKMKAIRILRRLYPEGFNLE